MYQNVHLVSLLTLTMRSPFKPVEQPHLQPLMIPKLLLVLMLVLLLLQMASFLSKSTNFNFGVASAS